MKEEEKIFFKACIVHAGNKIAVMDIVNIMSGFVPAKRLMYFVQKWVKLGFYNYGTSMYKGWFEVQAMPERYKLLVMEAIEEYYGTRYK